MVGSCLTEEESGLFGESYSERVGGFVYCRTLEIVRFYNEKY